jgi:hypothetical protein
MAQRLSATLAILLTPVAWPIGMSLLWRSSAWTRTEKVLGTVVIPGGIWTAFLFESGDRSSCPIVAAGSTTGPCVIGPTYHWLHPASEAFNHVFGALVFASMLIVPLVVAGYLAFRLRQRWTALGD